jgi:hypothetical protein
MGRDRIGSQSQKVVAGESEAKIKKFRNSKSFEEPAVREVFLCDE